MADEAIVNKIETLLDIKLASLKREIKETKSMAKKVKVEEFNKKSHQKQYEHNTEVRGKMEEAAELLGEDERDGNVQKIIAEGMDIIDHRNKCIKIAYTSDQGWLAVQEYEKSAIASDSDDDKKIRQARSNANRIVKARKDKNNVSHKNPRVSFRNDEYARTSRYEGAGTDGYKGGYAGGYNGGHGAGYAGGYGSSQKSQYSQGQWGQRNRANDICRRCGQVGHWARDCSYSRQQKSGN